MLLQMVVAPGEVVYSQTLHQDKIAITDSTVESADWTDPLSSRGQKTKMKLPSEFVTSD